jgi:cytochrome b561
VADNQPAKGVLIRNNRKLIKRIIHWTMVAYIVVYVVSGFGITNFQTMESLTLGLMGKATAMQLHNNMELPFLVLILAHVYVSLIMRKQKPE